MNSSTSGLLKTFGVVVDGGVGVILGRSEALDEVQEGVLVYKIDLGFFRLVISIVSISTFCFNKIVQVIPDSVDNIVFILVC